MKGSTNAEFCFILLKRAFSFQREQIVITQTVCREGTNSAYLGCLQLLKSALERNSHLLRKLRALEHFKESLHRQHKCAWGKAEHYLNALWHSQYQPMSGHNAGHTGPQPTKSLNVRKIFATDILQLTKHKARVNR